MSKLRGGGGGRERKKKRGGRGRVGGGGAKRGHPYDNRCKHKLERPVRIIVLCGGAPY